MTAVRHDSFTINKGIGCNYICSVVKLLFIAFGVLKVTTQASIMDVGLNYSPSKNDCVVTLVNI